MSKKRKVIYTPTFIKSCKRAFSANPVYAVPRFCRDIRWKMKAVWHRIFRGYDDSMLWGLSDSLPPVIIAALDYMIENLNGWPSAKVKTFNEWKKILKEMRKGFMAINRLNHMDYNFRNKKQLNRLEAEAEKGLKLFVEYYFHLWD